MNTRRSYKCRVLLVEAHRKIKLLRLFHRLHKYLLIHNRNPIVCEACRTRLGKCLHIHKLSSAKSLGHCRRRQHMYPCLCTFFKNIGKSIHIVDRRLGICHAHNRCEAALGCRRRPGKYVLLIGKPRIPEMHMCIHKSRRNHQSCRVNHVECILLIIHITAANNISSLTYAGGCLSLIEHIHSLVPGHHNLSTIDKNIHDLIHTVHRVNNPAVFYKQHNKPSLITYIFFMVYSSPTSSRLGL